MKKFILLTFGFLAFAFYQLSGGADFEPASARDQATAPTDAPDVTVAEIPQPTPQPSTGAVADTVPKIVPREDAGAVTRVALNLTSVSDVTTAEAEATVATTETSVPQNVAATSDGTVIASADTPAIMPSLIVPNDTGVTNQQTTLSLNEYDVREVTGSRVNVRGGPGTNYGVVTKLRRGDAVEILEDNGDGWVRMRPIVGGPEGWMADFLLSAN